MTATLAARLDTPPTAVDIDRLAMEFLALESKVDDAYKIATSLDAPHEKMKEELICLVEEFHRRCCGRTFRASPARRQADQTALPHF
jgi:hypothetical protein